MGFKESLFLWKGAKVVLTDSGGHTQGDCQLVYEQSSLRINPGPVPFAS